MVRRIGAVAAGVAVVGVVVMTLQMVGSLIHPVPPGVDPTNPDDLSAFTAYLVTMPFSVWALAWASEVLGAFLGALVASKIADTKKQWFAGGIVGVALLGSIMNWIAFPHPMWFIVGQLVAYPLVFLAVSKFLPNNPYEGV